MRNDTIEYEVGQFFLPVLINGDSTGLTDAEERQLRDFLDNAEVAAAEAGATHWHWDCDIDESPGFSRCDITGLYADTVRVWQVLFLKEEDA